MIDFHSHILPALDDGSKNIEESLALLNMLSQQGVDTVVATPHFSPDKESVDDFLLRRRESFESLSSSLSEEHPKIIMGAEVLYYDGISSLQGLEKLCIGDTNLLLLEMPMCKWSAYAYEELKTLSYIKGFTVILAHIERYMRYQPQSQWAKLKDLGILNQVNASFFIRPLTRRKALSMLLSGNIHAIGSDCHGVETRPPLMDTAFEYIKSKTGRTFLKDFTEYNKELLFEN
ncbi:MAG: hypothetical protein E7566_03090 [Ruminococcaceae bacterium]|nr:hypothetical protein [Oscillospiraceae bacterium]